MPCRIEGDPVALRAAHEERVRALESALAARDSELLAVREAAERSALESSQVR